MALLMFIPVNRQNKNLGGVLLSFLLTKVDTTMKSETENIE